MNNGYVKLSRTYYLLVRVKYSMKSVFTSFSIAVFSLVNISPSIATITSRNQVSNSPKSIQAELKTIKIAQFGGVFNTIKKGQDVIERQRRMEESQLRREEARERREEAEQRRQERLEAAKKRREEYEAAKKAATEKQRLEAERRREYYESLSPEEKKAYIAKQQEIQRQQWSVVGNLFRLYMESSSSESSSSTEDTTCIRSRPDGSMKTVC